jgi:hypothetical protein
MPDESEDGAPARDDLAPQDQHDDNVVSIDQGK